MIARKLTYEKIFQYFENLAIFSNLIDGFIGFSQSELIQKINSSEGTQGFQLILFGYSGVMQGTNQKSFAGRTISFAILTVVPIDDFEVIYENIGQAEKIGLHILSRINYDSKMPENFLYNSFDKDSVRFSEVIDRENNNLAGMEFHFTIKNSEPLIIDPKEWNDLKDVCDD